MDRFSLSLSLSSLTLSSVLNFLFSESLNSFIVHIAANIQSVALPSTDVNVGDIVTPSGWGKPSDGKPPLTLLWNHVTSLVYT